MCNESILVKTIETFVKYLPTIRPPRKASPAPVVSTILFTFGGLVHTTCYSMFNRLTRCSSHSHVNLIYPLLLITIATTSYITKLTLCIEAAHVKQHLILILVSIYTIIISIIVTIVTNNYIHYCYHSYSKSTYYV